MTDTMAEITAAVTQRRAPRGRVCGNCGTRPAPAAIRSKLGVSHAGEHRNRRRHYRISRISAPIRAAVASPDLRGGEYLGPHRTAAGQVRQPVTTSAWLRTETERLLGGRIPTEPPHPIG